MTVYPCTMIPEKIAQSVPAEWGTARRMDDVRDIYEYNVNILHSFLVSQGVIFCVVLSVDGHNSHLTHQLSVLCKKLKIQTRALYPDATRTLQPEDVAVFRPAAMRWRKAVREWHAKPSREVLNKVTFAPLLREVIHFSAKPETLVNGSQACGSIH